MTRSYSAMSLYPLKASFILFTVWVFLGWLAGAPTQAQEASAVSGIAVPHEPAPILPLADVRIGMKGYGLTVFHGDKIEPFAVEVVSVMNDFSPQRSVIWIRCPDERMQKLGPVQGMSGSPIYLWSEGENHIPGQGGKLIGAFAYGYMLTKDCYAGVQPIEQMRAVARIQTEASSKSAPPAGVMSDPSSVNAPVPLQQVAGHSWSHVHEMLATLTKTQSPNQHPSWRTKFMLDLLASQKTYAGISDGRSGAMTSSSSGFNNIGAGMYAAGPTPTNGGLPLALGQPQRMMLPMMLRTPALAQAMSPLMQAHGLLPMAASAGMPIGRPPVEIELSKLQLAPGSILSIPLAFGDMDLSASGTVTEVLPDGQVLAFGHPMFGDGATALPMASGFVHYVVPSHLSSFKLAGSGNLVGSIVRDESSAVLGLGEKRYSTAPAVISVQHPDRANRTYRYQVVQHRELTPMIAAIVAAESMTAEVGLPTENTLHVDGSLTFTGGHKLQLQSISPGGSPMSLLYELLMPISMLANNPFQSLMLENVDVQVRVQPGIEALTLVQARVEQTQLKPGQTVVIQLVLQPYGKPRFTRRLEFPLPANLPDGSYQLMLGDASTYHSQMMDLRPHRSQLQRIEDVLQSLQELATLRDDALYLSMTVPGEGLAVGRTELPLLPSSRRAMLTAPSGTSVSAMGSWTQRIIPMEAVVQGSLMLAIQVKKETPAR